jgi:hypothetical protein
MRTLLAPLLAFVCVVFHRSQRMVYAPGRKRMIVCKVCDENGKKDEVKNIILTFLFLNPSILAVLILLPVIPLALMHEWLTGRLDYFERSQEHHLREWVWFP